MLNLARKLADCDQSLFDGWVIADAEVVINTAIDYYADNIIINRGRMSVITVQGYTKKNEIAEALKVILLKPSVNRCLKQLAVKQGSPLLQYSFSVHEVQEYIISIGDNNSIHLGKKPVVPGMLMLAKLQQLLQLQTLSWKVKFLESVYTEQLIELYSFDDSINAYADDKLVFVIKNVKQV